MFSSDVRVFLSKPISNSKSTAESSTLFIEHILKRQVLVAYVA